MSWRICAVLPNDFINTFCEINTDQRDLFGQLLPSEEGTTQNGFEGFCLQMARVKAKIWP